MNRLELYDRTGRLIRSVAVSQDEQDATKWHLAEPIALGVNEIESAVMRFGDGTSHAVEPSLFPTRVRINTLFKPIHRPVQMRPRCPARLPDQSNLLPLCNFIALFH